ncbi:MAG: methionyl-tRNA formyltransferase [Candidatus Dormibacteria bacterium]
MRIVFFGTPQFAVPSLEALLERHELVLAVTQPDRPAGRGLAVRASAVADRAEAAQVPVIKPTRAREPELLEQVVAARADVIVVAAYGQILPLPLLGAAAHGALNVHASLLPRWRGASPISAAILSGDAETGVSIMQMDEGLDTGPVLLQAATLIGEQEDAEELGGRLSRLGAAALLEALAAVESGRAVATPQPTEGVTYAGLVKKSHGLLDWTLPAEHLGRALRAFRPWPGVRLPLAGEAVQVVAGHPLPQWWAGRGSDTVVAGEVVEVAAEGIVVMTATTPFLVQRVKPAGKREMAAVDFARGHRELAARK